MNFTGLLLDPKSFRREFGRSRNSLCVWGGGVGLGLGCMLLKNVQFLMLIGATLLQFSCTCTRKISSVAILRGKGEISVLL